MLQYCQLIDRYTNSMSSPIARFEAFMERILETSIARILDSRLEQSVIMRRLERIMESNQVMHKGTIYVPHNYYAFVNPIDFKSLNSQNDRINLILTDYLMKLSQNRKFRTIQEVNVQLISDPACDLATVRIEFDPIPIGSSESTDNFDAVQNAFDGVELPTGIYTRPERFTTASVYQLIITLEDDVKTVPITKTELRIGRDLENDIVLREHLVSRNHARINYNKQRFYITDLASSNGTFVNNQRINQPTYQIVLDEDTISIGSYTLQLQRIHHDE